MSALTHHARHRLQQRAIPSLVLDLLEECGSVARTRDGDSLFFDKAARRRLRHRLGGERGMRMIEPWLGIYAVVGDQGLVITAGPRRRRLRR